jgi:hypothetical protein
MNPAPIDTRIQVIFNSNQHHYRIGGIYRVHKIDSDGTFKAIDDQGIEGDALYWCDCDVIGLGWEWLSTQLDADSLDLLSAFDGLQNLRMRPGVELRIVRNIPNLADAIRNKLPDVEQSLLLRQQSPAPDADDLSNDSFMR